jgi:hypothetical protein
VGSDVTNITLSPRYQFETTGNWVMLFEHASHAHKMVCTVWAKSVGQKLYMLDDAELIRARTGEQAVWVRNTVNHTISVDKVAFSR